MTTLFLLAITASTIFVLYKVSQEIRYWGRCPHCGSNLESGGWYDERSFCPKGCSRA